MSAFNRPPIYRTPPLRRIRYLPTARPTRETYEDVISSLEEIASRRQLVLGTRWPTLSDLRESDFKYQINAMIMWLRENPSTQLRRTSTPQIQTTSIACNDPIKYIEVMTGCLDERVTYKQLDEAMFYMDVDSEAFKAALEVFFSPRP